MPYFIFPRWYKYTPHQSYGRSLSAEPELTVRQRSAGEAAPRSHAPGTRRTPPREMMAAPLSNGAPRTPPSLCNAAHKVTPFGRNTQPEATYSITAPLERRQQRAPYRGFGPARARANQRPGPAGHVAAPRRETGAAPREPLSAAVRSRRSRTGPPGSRSVEHGTASAVTREAPGGRPRPPVTVTEVRRRQGRGRSLRRSGGKTQTQRAPPAPAAPGSRASRQAAARLPTPGRAG